MGFSPGSLSHDVSLRWPPRSHSAESDYQSLNYGKVSLWVRKQPCSELGSPSRPSCLGPPPSIAGAQPWSGICGANAGRSRRPESCPVSCLGADLCRHDNPAPHLTGALPWQWQLKQGGEPVALVTAAGLTHVAVGPLLSADPVAVPWGVWGLLPVSLDLQAAQMRCCGGGRGVRHAFLVKPLPAACLPAPHRPEHGVSRVDPTEGLGVGPLLSVALARADLVQYLGFSPEPCVESDSEPVSSSAGKSVLVDGRRPP